MITELAPAERTSLSVGDFVQLTDPDGPDRLAVVADTEHRPNASGPCRCGCAIGTPSEQVTVLCADDVGPDGIRAVATLTVRLVAAEPEAYQQDDQARALTGALVDRCIRDRDDALRQRDEADERARGFEARIASMRSYAIDRHRDGQICRDGLNAFLQAHDLPVYAPSYEASVDVTVRVRVHCDDDEYHGDLQRIIENHLTVDTDDSDRLDVDDFTIGYDAIGDVEEIAD